jgi:hypothetical protein
MASLFTYQTEAQKWLRETKQDLINPQNLVNYINRARREVAMRTQCIRVLTRSSAPIVTASVVTGGHSYSNTPTISITPPDFPSGTGAFPNGAQATASAIVQSGTIAAVDITYGGDGYFQPIVSGITDASGTGASITLQTGPINTLNVGQEVYNFSDIYLGANPGVKSIFAIRSVSVIYANYRYSLPKYDFTTYQSMIRQYPYQYQYVPTFCSQFGQGVAGSLYMYPLPSETYQYEVDCYCLPQDLKTNQDYEAVPDPWTDAVSYFATHLSYLELQNYNAAKMYKDLYNEELLIYSQSSRIGRAVNPYGRY